jgi:hypothetical protein
MFSQEIKPGKMSPGKTSPGPPLFKKNIVDIEFEGDGPLGIRFINKDNKAFVASIINNTVASEYFVEENMKIIGIEDYNCKHMSFKDILDLISSIWKIKSKINVKFEKIPEDLCLNEDCPIFNFLKENGCENYYTKFKNLGANSISDFEFIEYSDLLNMNMSEEQSRKLFENIKKISQVFSEADDI